ncbi:MAG: Rab family GTPase [Promethearchaeota archaeon]
MNIPQDEIFFTFKVVLIGSGGVGKTCLFNRYCFNSFNFNTEMTIGINFHSNYIKVECQEEKGIKQKKFIVNSIFDFGGQERFKPLIPKFLNGADGALLIFDSISFTSFQQLEFWYEQLVKYCGDPDIPKILVGSKCDLINKVTKAEIVNDSLINNFIQKKKLDGFYRTSALENYNVIEVFKILTSLMLKKREIEVIMI